MKADCDYILVQKKWDTILILLFSMSYVIDTEKLPVQMNTISTGNS